MGFFDEIEDLFNNMEGGFGEFSSLENGRRTFKKDYSSENFVETERNVFFILELPNDNVENINIVKDNYSNKNIEIVLSDNQKIYYVLPKKIKDKKIDWKSKNGILEVKFAK